MPTLPGRTISVSIDRPWAAVYAYASDPANLSHWAAGLGESFERAGDEWLFKDPGGRPVRLRFASSNPYGVLDHDVILPDRVVHVALRVMPNGDGAEVSFLLLRDPGIFDEDFERDAAAVTNDLASLKHRLER